MIKASIPWTCKQVHKMTTNGSLIFDNAIQRGFVWDKNRQSLLIDSILRGFPVPPFYTIKDGRTVQTPKGQVAVFDAIDGKQRCTTITRFKDNMFALCNLKQTIITEDGTELDLNGLKYEDLPDDLKDTFDTTSLTVYYFTDATDEEITEMMSRLNNGKPLSACENVRIKAKDLPGIQELANSQVFIENMSEAALSGYQNEDVVVKTYAVLTQENKSLDNKAIRPLYESLIVTDEIKNRLSVIFNTIYALHHYLDASKKKKVAKKLITRTHMISIAPIIERAANENRDAKELAEFFTDFFNGSPSKSEVYNTACQNGSNHTANVEARLNELRIAYDDYFNTNVFESSDGTDNTDSGDTVMNTGSDDNDNTADNNYA